MPGHLLGSVGTFLTVGLESRNPSADLKSLDIRGIRLRMVSPKGDLPQASKRDFEAKGAKFKEEFFRLAMDRFGHSEDGEARGRTMLRFDNLNVSRDRAVNAKLG